MKKKLVVLSALIIALTACNKEPDRLSFSIKNLTTLLEKSNDYIEKYSPGSLADSNEEYITFDLANKVEGIENAVLYYGLDNQRSFYIDFLPERKNEISEAEKLIAMAENEFDRGNYFLSYYDENSQLQNKDFFTLSEMSSFISANAMTASDVKMISGIFVYGKYSVFAGGVNSGGISDPDFVPMLEITTILVVTPTN